MGETKPTNSQIIAKIGDEVKAKGLDLMKKVNAVAAGSTIGVEELSDVANTFYDVCEVIEDGNEGQPITLMLVISVVAPGLLPAFLGVEQVPAEAMDLQDEEITFLVNLGDQHTLGENAEKYKAALKLVLVALQTYSVFS